MGGMENECSLLHFPAIRVDLTPACRWCGGPLPVGRRRWCSDACDEAYRDQHIWSRARELALVRDGYECTVCDRTDVEVHHDPPVDSYRPGCQHHLDKLVTLCVFHHHERHRQASGTKPVQLSLIAA